MYGILISLSIFVASSLAERILMRYENKKDSEHLWGIVFIVIVLGVIGARFYHVLDLLPYYLKNPVQIFQIWKGGLGIFGAIFGGVLGLYLYTKKHKLNLWYWTDLVALVTPLAQAIARWGNFFNKELYGLPTSLPWAMFIPKEKGYFHPLFLYESIANLILFLLLINAYHEKTFNLGSAHFISYYLLGYSIIRFLIEFLKIDPWKIGPINVAQGICIILGGISTAYLTGVLKFKHDLYRK